MIAGIPRGRPWWQMTARPKLSRNLGVLFAVVTASVILGLALELAGVTEPALNPVASVFGLIEFAALAFLYLNSAVRLRQRGIQPTEPTFRPKRLPVG